MEIEEVEAIVKKRWVLVFCEIIIAAKSILLSKITAIVISDIANVF